MKEKQNATADKIISAQGENNTYWHYHWHILWLCN